MSLRKELTLKSYGKQLNCVGMVRYDTNHGEENL